ncbi:MAG: Photosystem I assembly protein Ycf3 [Chlamydiae bacterium]|nr:Photosystem I assembly protein Ycf3 [Chlamydiota bacterium]
MSSSVKSSVLESQQTLANLFLKFSEGMQHILHSKELSADDRDSFQRTMEVVEGVSKRYLETGHQSIALEQRLNEMSLSYLKQSVEMLLPLKERELELAEREFSYLREAAQFLRIDVGKWLSSASHEEIPSESRLTEDTLSKLMDVFQVKIDQKDQTFEEKRQACFEKVLLACKQKDWKSVETYRNELAYLTNQVGQTILLHVVSSGKTKLLKELVERKIALRSSDNNGNSALHLAAKNGDVTSFRLLWEYIPDEENSDGQTPLEIAILTGQADVVSFIAANVKNLSSPFDWHSLKVTPLAFAALRGEIACVEILLKKVPFTDAPTPIGNILHLIIYFQQNEMLEYLLSEHFAECKNILEEKNQDGQTPLALAVFVDNPQAVSLLSVRGANIEAEDLEGRRPLHLAALTDNHFMVKCLIALNCDIDPRAAPRVGRKTPYDMAPKGSSTQVLLGRLMDVEKVNQSEIPQFRYRPPQNLVFKGGGPKGVAYLGALQTLEEKGDLTEVKRIAGTSAGAITAALLAMNFSIEEIKKLLAKKPLTEFLDHNLPEEKFKAIESLIKNPPAFSLDHSRHLWKQPSITHAYQALCETYQNCVRAISLKEPIESLYKSLLQQPGICVGKDFENWIEGQIYEKTKTPYCTFGELQDLILQGNGFKHLHVFSVQIIGKKQNLIRFSSEEDDWNDVVISSAIRASMSIPGVFVPAIIKRKKKGETNPSQDESLGSFIDGGITYNFPIEAFDEKRFITEGLKEEERRCPVFNKRTLGFSLFSSDETIPKAEPIKDIGQLLRGIMAIFRKADEFSRQRTPYNAHRTIQIDNQGVGLLDFDLSTEQIEALILSGEKATKSFYKKQKGVSNQSLFNYPKLRLEVKGFYIKSVHPFFVGRKDLLSQIHKDLSENPVLLYGPGGIGKSELGIAYANAHLSDFDLVFFFKAETPESLEQSYEKLAKILEIYIEKSDFKEIRRKVHNKLKSAKNWLLLYDNLEKPIPLPKGGKILITSRKKLTDLPPETHPIEVPPFVKEDAIELLKKVTGEDPSPAMEQLVERVGAYPLVLGQIALYIKRCDHLSISQYLDECKDGDLDFRRMTPEKRYERSLAEVFENLMPTLKPLEKEWLQICSYLNPDSIPLYYLEEWLKNEHHEENMLVARDDILATLSTEQAFLRYDSSTKTYSIHRLFQESLKNKHEESSYNQACQMLIKLWDQLDFYNIRDWGQSVARAEEFYAHSILLMGNPKFKALSAEEQSKFYSKTGSTNHLFAKYPEALEKHEKALAILQEALDPNHPDIAMSLLSIGRCLNEQGKYKTALEKFEQALELQNDSLAPDHPVFAHIFNNIGLYFFQQRKFKNALKKFEQALEIQKKSLEPNHPILATLHGNIGCCLSSLGKTEKATEKFQESLKIRKTSLDPNHPDIAYSLKYIGESLTEQGKTKEGLKEFEKALEIQKKSLDSNHPDIALTLCSFGSCFLQQKKYKKALEKFEQALEIQTESLDSNHPDIASTLNSIGCCLYGQGKYQESAKCYSKAYWIVKPSLGDDHSTTKLYLKNYSDAKNPDDCVII